MKHNSRILFLVIGLFTLFAGIVLLTAWNNSTTIGLMGNAERASITNVRFVEGDPAGDTIKITVGNSGSFSVTIHEGYVNGIKAININSGPTFTIPKASALEITLKFPNSTLINGTQQAVKLITTKGTSIVFSLIYDSTSTSQYNPLKDDIIPTPSAFYAPTTAEREQAKVLFVTIVLGVIADVGACFFANHIIQPRNRVEFFVLLFLVTVIVGFAMMAVVSNILFPPIGLM